MPTSSSERSSRIPGFYRMSRAARLEALREAGFLSEEDAALLSRDAPLLEDGTAEAMIENVVARFELPLGIGLNFVINGRDRVVPMAVEEPSIVAAVSHAANIVRQAGGFEAGADRSVMTAQIQVVGSPDPVVARERILAARQELLAQADALEPGMVRRGGGATDLEVRHLRPRGSASRYEEMLVVHVYVDTCDAMGANLINTVAEGLAERVEKLSGGRVFLRILSNLNDRRRVRASCRVPAHLLAWHGFPGDEVARAIERASVFAEQDPYRAATHNKGIMNGIDAVAIATGQDWRAIEAGAHAFAASDGTYGPLARWTLLPDGCLEGVLDMPMAVGTVGGPIRLHPVVQAMHRMLDVRGAADLACVLGSVGLAQNLAAIKALGTTGIQKGHMALHARSVAATAGALGDEVELVAAELIAAGQIKVAVATERLRALREARQPRAVGDGSA
ncbi:MAG: hydroxymethylglutaryl-CoA reductase, degradative [Deltaproteobacteria bacterium]|nr:MAG: hydroxymethylglutaryl-CoA reductase, degradative [Deltaproteobacteria bacterium]